MTAARYRVVPSERAHYGPGRWVAQYFSTAVGAWFDVGDPVETIEEAQARVALGRPRFKVAENAGKYLDEHPGHAIDWEPGDWTRYEIVVVDDVSRSFSDAERALVIVNLGGHVLPFPNTAHPPEALRAYWIERLPRGSWAGLRPLLAALGAAEGPLTYNRDDSADEATLRRST